MKKEKISSVQLIPLSFLIAIALGGLILMLPISSATVGLSRGLTSQLNSIGKNMVELNLRKNYKINVIAYKNHENGHWKILDPTEPLLPDSELLIVLERDELHRINK